MKKSIQIFRPGKHVAMSGVALSFSESDLAATVAAYDPAKHEAPLVVGHPKHDDPAYGWVDGLAFADGALCASPVQVDSAFAEMVGRGAFKKISASFYSPASPSNPVPGVYYLRHVGFLGAQPPAVKGLRNPEFADSEVGVVEFSEWDAVDSAGLLRSLRDWIIGKFGQDEADKALPSYQVKSVEQGAQDDLRAAQQEPSAGVVSPAFTESQPEGGTMTPEEKARMDALEKQATGLAAENAALKKSNADFAEAQAKSKALSTHAENLAFAETLVNSGKLLPAAKSSTVALMDSLAAQGGVVEFGEGEGKKSLPPLAAYMAQLEAIPVRVDYGEAAGVNKGVAPDANDAVAVAAKAVEFQEAEAKAGRVVSATAAVQHVSKGGK